ncbi:MAG: FecR domain-containing protein [Asticcacaulis sp.]|nr:FecR domain-containing protein [Asticcacaulis sp.]
MPLTEGTIEDQAAAWLARMQAVPDDAERAAFAAWHDADPRHAGAYLRAEAAWMLLDRAQVMSHGDTFLARQAAADKLNRHHAARTRRYVLGGAAAASVTAAAFVGYRLSHVLSLETGRGELRNVPLKDRSTAAVNTDSRIEVSLGDKLRHVELVKGEAWFEVAKNPDAPFVVSAGDIRVRAVGTAFSVRRRDGGADVLVTEGVVEAWNVRDKTKRVTLKAGAEAFVPNAPEAAAVAYKPEEVERKLAWRDREIILNSTALGDAVAEFNRYNSREIVIADPGLSKAELVGGFHVDEPDSFARAVHTALNVPVSIGNDRIVIGAAKGA